MFSCFIRHHTNCPQTGDVLKSGRKGTEKWRKEKTFSSFSSILFSLFSFSPIFAPSIGHQSINTSLMDYLKHFLLAALSLTTSMMTSAQTDVTAQYLINPSFEADATACTDGVRKSENADGLRGWDVSTLTGWTTTRPDKQLLITADCFTDNNFGKTDIPDGSPGAGRRKLHPKAEDQGILCQLRHQLGLTASERRRPDPRQHQFQLRPRCYRLHGFQ